MPREDKTGPNGQGARTGRGLGQCKTNPDTSERITRRGGRGPGDGTGRRVAISKTP